MDPLLLTNQMNQLQLNLIAGKNALDFQFCSSFEIASTLVEAGFGISLIPESLVDINNTNLISIDFIDSPSFTYGIYYRKDTNEKIIKILVDQCIKYFILCTYFYTFIFSTYITIYFLVCCRLNNGYNIILTFFIFFVPLIDLLQITSIRPC